MSKCITTQIVKSKCYNFLNERGKFFGESKTGVCEERDKESSRKRGGDGVEMERLRGGDRRRE